MDYSVFVRKVRNRVGKLLCRPIEVFVFHAVSDVYEESLTVREDWSSTDEFKKTMLLLKEEYQFISLERAYEMLNHDRVRAGNYAVLTCDDGFRSVLGILPFLEEQQVPVTIFVNSKYLDGKSIRSGYADSPQYLSEHDLWGITSQNVTVGMHGYEHNDATSMTQEQFAESVDKCMDMLRKHPRYVPYYAYTWGRYSETTQQVLREKGIVPVFTDGGSNHRYRQGIGRKCIDSYYYKKKMTV